MHLFDFVAILVIVSMLGTEFSISAILNPALDRLDRATWLKTMPELARAIGKVMPFWYAIGLLCICAEVYFHFNAASLWWLGVAGFLWVVGIVYSITMLVPINNRIANAQAETDSIAAADHRRWDALHRWRVVLLLVATTCLLVGIV